ncbi:hypothetical protein PR048_004810 [Dryococelus australis]|uniref:HAT C-terminal dimerisation domain-containing protein n=1 Tax=Dryococelus australis TaxID=614101 RepID=A0ABQ9I6H5_9NEOP|nr:hypothetical protein PR048_004810 [Dryococelus australis]
MLEHLHEQKEAVSADLPNYGKECLTAQEWNFIAGYVTILQPLFLATKELYFFFQVHDFLKSAAIDRDGDPLEWWKSCRNYPCLAELAMHYLSIPAISVASESVFPKAGLTISTQCQNVSSSLAEKLVFLHDNL